MIHSAAIAFFGLLTACLATNAIASDDEPGSVEVFRVMSWNISDDAFVSQKHAFQSVLQWANPDVVLLDEVAPSASIAELVKHLDTLRPGEHRAWNVSVGASGGRQRTVIAAREPLVQLPQFQSVVPYPESDKRRILDLMTPYEREYAPYSMDDGIPVNGAIIQVGKRKLLAIVTDLQCCGDGPESWQELRRRVEAREIRSLIRKVLGTHAVDGLIFAGDFNMVNSTFPMALLLGPFPRPHAGLIPAELYHTDSDATWTWDGRETPFPSNTLDYQFYSPHSLSLRSGLILDSEAAPAELRRQFGLETDTLSLTGRHRPLVVEYGWN